MLCSVLRMLCLCPHRHAAYASKTQVLLVYMRPHACMRAHVLCGHAGACAMSVMYVSAPACYVCARMLLRTRSLPACARMPACCSVCVTRMRACCYVCTACARMPACCYVCAMYVSAPCCTCVGADIYTAACGHTTLVAEGFIH